MLESFKYKGTWFLPSSKEIKVPGVLEYNPVTGLKLILDKAIHTGKTGGLSILSMPHEAEFILGETSAGYITLYNCFQTKSSSGGTEGFYSEWTLNYAFVGIHADQEKKLNFTKISAEITNLFDWIGQSGLSVDGFPKIHEEIIMRFNPATPLAFDVDDNVLGNIHVTYNIKFPNTYSKSIDLNLSARLEIETREGFHFSFEEVKDRLSQFLHWLTIATGKKCQPIIINLYHRKLTKVRHKKEWPGRVDLYTNSFLPAVRSNGDYAYDFNFDLAKLDVRASQIITRWFTLYPDLNITNQVLAERLRDEDKFNENNFKDVAQALESFHRTRRNNERRPKEEYAVMVESILENVQNGDYRKFLQERLNFGNEPTLAERLRELISETESDALTNIIGDIDEFIRLVKNNRNYYTHYDPKLKKKSLSSSDLYYLNEKLLALLFVTIMNEVFQDKPFVDLVLRESRRWGHLTR